MKINKPYDESMKKEVYISLFFIGLVLGVCIGMFVGSKCIIK